MRVGAVPHVQQELRVRSSRGHAEVKCVGSGESDGVGWDGGAYGEFFLHNVGSRGRAPPVVHPDIGRGGRGRSEGPGRLQVAFSRARKLPRRLNFLHLRFLLEL